MLTILVVDDEYLVRKGIRETIDWSFYGAEIIGEACDGEEGLQLALEHNPDIILTDIRMPFMDGLEFMEKLRNNGLESSIIVLSGYEEFSYVRTAMQFGAADYLLKPIDNRQLTDTVLKTSEKIKKERSTKYYFQRLQNELSSIKKHFLQELLSGSITDSEEIMDKLKFYEMPIALVDNYAICVRIDEFAQILQQLTPVKLNGLRERILEYIAQYLLLNKRFNGLVLEKGEAEWVILLQVLNPSDDILALLKECAIQLADQIDKLGEASVSIGISDICTNVAHISRAYREAYTASFFQILPGSSSVGHIKEKEVTGYRWEINEAIRYIRCHFRENITVDMAAKELFISASHLMHLFREQVGKTFNDCLTEYRIQAAREMLKDPRNKVYEVCERIGYGDVKYFSQLFKKITGTSPSEYMKR